MSHSGLPVRGAGRDLAGAVGPVRVAYQSGDGGGHLLGVAVDAESAERAGDTHGVGRHRPPVVSTKAARTVAASVSLSSTGSPVMPRKPPAAGGQPMLARRSAHRGPLPGITQRSHQRSFAFSGRPGTTARPRRECARARRFHIPVRPPRRGSPRRSRVAAAGRPRPRNDRNVVCGHRPGWRAR